MSLSLTRRLWKVRHDARAALPPTGPAAAPHILALLAQERQVQIGMSDERSAVFLLPDLPRAVERIWQAVDRREAVTIFGDYDCDGITSAVQMLRFFRRHDTDATVRLPHRLHEGYGLKLPHIAECVAAKTSLLITVDTGIASVAEIQAARGAGIDVIVIDHHHLREELPDAVALLHPALAPGYPEPHPSASGLVSMVVAALELARGNVNWTDRESDRALAALGTVADLVELRGENRSIVEQGIAALRNVASGPLLALKDAAGLGTIITSRDIAFRLAPRINAAGRMESPDIAMAALLGDAQALQRLEVLNRERQERVRSHWDALLPRVDSSAPMLFAADAGYTPGIVGLLAGKLTETYGKPSFVGSLTDAGSCVASLRSIRGYHVTEGLARCTDLLDHFGGHAQAAGAHLPASALPELTRRMGDDVAARVPQEELVPMLDIDVSLDTHHVCDALCGNIRLLEPFGQGNLEPRFLLPSVLLTDVRTCGSDSSHLQARAGGHKLIGFGFGALAEHAAQPLDIACRIGTESFRGRTSLQLYLDDLRIAQPLTVPAKIPTTLSIPT